MSFINDNFMLKNETARELYAAVKDLPIIDYHCHLVPRMIADDYKFKNAYELFLGGDHYKWRQMRTFGIDEKYITGDADDYEKFEAYAKALPYMIGNIILLHICKSNLAMASLFQVAKYMIDIK